MYLMARDSAVKAQRQVANQLKAILVTADPALREELAMLSRRARVGACLELNEGDDDTEPVVRATRCPLRVLAERIEQLRAQARMLEGRLSDLVRQHHPQLIDAVGIGPHSAAVLLTAVGDNRERLRGEASFAALCGASPVGTRPGTVNIVGSTAAETGVGGAVRHGRPGGAEGERRNAQPMP